MRRHLLYLMVLATLAPGAAAQSGGITVLRENGRTIYVDAPNPGPSKPTSSTSDAVRTPRRSSVLVYWSRAEQRWKPVPAPPAWAMRAARSAAAEVHRQVVAAPESPIMNTAESELSPDNREILRGRQMTSAELDSIIEEAAQRHNVDPNLVRAVIQVESNFNPRAVSRKGAVGLMQLMPSTARNLNVSNPFDPKQNVDGGVRHLKQLLEDFGGDVGLSLAAYNAGAGAVTRSNGVPPYAETRDYVRRVTKLYGSGKLLSGPTADPIRVFRDASGVLNFSNTD